MATKRGKGGKSVVRVKGYDLSRYGAKKSGAVTPAEARKVLQRAVDAIPASNLQSLRGGHILVIQ